MKSKEFLELMGNIDEKFLVEEEKNLATKRKGGGFSRLGIIAASIALLFSLAAAVYAVSPEFREYINLKFFMNNEQITETESIPKGYTPIYNKDDLDKIRNDLDAKYILMNDIVFLDADFAEGGMFEGGWEPIGTKQHPFTGVFNGNGHVVYGVKIKSSYEYTGLFGYCTTTACKTDTLPYTEGESIIKNLGISGAKIEITAKEQTVLNVGVLAGKAVFAAGCYVSDSEVCIDYSYSAVGYVNVGGICGEAHIIDSCSSDVDMRIDIKPYGETEPTGGNDTTHTASYCNVGGIAGRAYSVITSLSLSNFTSSSSSIVKHSPLVADTHVVPVMMNETAMNYITNALDRYTDEMSDSMSENEKKQFKLKITGKYIPTYVENPSDYTVYPNETATPETWYLLTGDLLQREHAEMLAIFDVLVENEKIQTDALIQAGLKTGVLFSYSFEDKSFEGFDFDNIWVKDENGIPKLKIFS